MRFPSFGYLFLLSHSFLLLRASRFFRRSEIALALRHVEAKSRPSANAKNIEGPTVAKHTIQEGNEERQRCDCETESKNSSTVAAHSAAVSAQTLLLRFIWGKV
mmetsp:Transcript_44087/g.134239  ORF Transcript_44087/g.134239 Transcript_44087/m.134239 type:complete len:104 (+) Transcript_44087:2026-2337(+)